MRRRPPTPQRARNSCNIHASGRRWRFGNCAKRRHARCSGNNVSNRLNWCTGVKTANRCSRQSWEGRNSRRRPRPRCGGQRELMKSSGICGESRRNKAAEPVVGSKESMLQTATAKATSCRQRTHHSIFSVQSTCAKQVAPNSQTPSIRGCLGIHFEICEFCCGIRSSAEIKLNLTG